MITILPDGSLTVMIARCGISSVVTVACACHVFAFQEEPSELPLLTISELRELAQPEPASEATLTKLHRLLNTPVVSNRSTSVAPEEPQPAGLQVAFWNIERGLQWERIAAALRDDADYRKRSEPKKPVSDHRWNKALQQASVLRRADIIILNEVDLGMKRTRYANVARELAEAAGMNYAFGVEFVEVDPLYTGDDHIEMKKPELSKALASDLRVDPERYRGLHGNAILSRFPIRSAKIKRLPECYDWYRKEMDRIAVLEKGRRWAAEKVFAERMTRQIRRGGRMSLVIEVDVGGRQLVTVVSTHLEDRSRSSCRRDQMREVLNQVREVRDPVVIGGDLNSSAQDGTPTSITYEIKKRVADPRFWAKHGIQWFTPVSIPIVFSFPLNLWKNHHDPTAINIPLIGVNKGRRSFNELRKFRFADGGRLDFSGDRTRSGNGRSHTLANTDERAWKGFTPTFHMQRTYFIAGTYKLDWLLVKEGPQSNTALYCQPHNPMTLRDFNEVGGTRLSDHHPMTVEIRCTKAVQSSAR